MSPTLRCHLGAVVEFEHDGALEHHLEVDGVGGVHAGVRRVHVPEKSGQLALDVGDRVLDVAEILFGCARLRRNGQHAEAEAANGREVGAPVGHRPVVGELRRRVAAPELVELGRREQRGPVWLDGLIAREHGLSGLIVAGHHSTHTHAASQSPRCVTPLPISLGQPHRKALAPCHSAKSQSLR